jgi:hypothetical protein
MVEDCDSGAPPLGSSLPGRPRGSDAAGGGGFLFSVLLSGFGVAWFWSSKGGAPFALELSSLDCSMKFWSRGVWIAPPDSGMEFGSGAMPKRSYSHHQYNITPIIASVHA